jgi:hypothetical protein
MIKARFGPKSMYSCAREWAWYLERMEEVRKARPSKSFFEIRYEDLLENTERVLGEICGFVGETYAPEMLDYHRDRTPYPTDAQNRQNLGKPVMAENKEKWRRQATKDELRVFEAVAGDALARYGYTRAIDAARMSRREESLRRYVEAPYRRAIARFKDYKGQKERLILLGLLSRRVGLAAAGRLAGRVPGAPVREERPI